MIFNRTFIRTKYSTKNKLFVFPRCVALNCFINAVLCRSVAI